MKYRYFMSKIILILIFQFYVKGFLWGQNNQFLYSKMDTTGVLTKYGYSDNNKKMVIPYERYSFVYTDTIKTIGFVLKSNVGIIAINTKGRELFRVFAIDNGPDYVSEGLIRILGKYNKMGFANMNGEIVIKPVYDAAYPFTGGKAAVCKGCFIQKKGEHSSWVGGKWGIINTRGKMETPYLYDSVVVSSNEIRGFIKGKGRWK